MTTTKRTPIETQGAPLDVALDREPGREDGYHEGQLSQSLQQHVIALGVERTNVEHRQCNRAHGAQRHV